MGAESEKVATSQMRVRVLPLLCYLLIAGSVGFFLLTIQQLPRGDEALYFLQSQIITEGGLPYRDFFHAIFPGGFYLGALLIQLAGPGFLVLRLAALLAMLSGLWTLYRMLGPYLDERLRLPALALIMLVLAQTVSWSYHIFSATAAMWALAFMLRFFREQRMRWLAWAFFLCGIAIVITQTRGVLFAGALLGSLLVATRVLPARLKPSDWLKSVLLPLAVPCIVLFVHLLISGTWNDFYRDTFHWLLTGHYSATSSHLYFDTGLKEMWNMLVAPGRQILWQNIPSALLVFGIAWLPVLGILWALQVVVSKRITLGRTHLELLATCLAAIALALSTLSYSTTFHIAMTALPGYFLGFLALQSLLRRGPAIVPVITNFGIAAMVLAILSQRYVATLDAYGDEYNWVASYGTTDRQYYLEGMPMAGLRYAIVIESIRKMSPGGSVFIYNSSPELYFLSGRKPVSRFMLVYPVFLSDDQVSELMTTLERERPELMVYDHKMEKLHRDHRFKKHRKEQLQLPTLTRFAEANYKAFPIEEFTLYRRGK